ncbi:MAG: DUF6607 family protein [Oligoflexus sp.]
MKQAFLQLIGPSALLLQISIPVHANEVYEAERKAIKAQTGCFEVEFRFQETFPYQSDYQLAKPYYAKAKEWVELIEDQTGKVSLQHVLQTPAGPIKHWRQVWQYEVNSVFQYQGNHEWMKVEVDPSLQASSWAQKVYQVDDSPRYECVASWTNLNRAPYWECETFSPLPRRENNRLISYDILQRRNRHIIQGDDWIHEQDNLKLQFVDHKLQPLVAEKGQNTYRRLPLAECNEARLWWEDNREAWLQVQHAWDRVYHEAQILSISQSQSRELSQVLYSLVDDYKHGEIKNLQKTAYQAITDIIEYR